MKHVITHTLFYYDGPVFFTSQWGQYYFLSMNIGSIIDEDDDDVFVSQSISYRQHYNLIHGLSTPYQIQKFARGSMFYANKNVYTRQGAFKWSNFDNPPSWRQATDEEVKDSLIGRTGYNWMEYRRDQIQKKKRQARLNYKSRKRGGGGIKHKLGKRYV